MRGCSEIIEFLIEGPSFARSGYTKAVGISEITLLLEIKQNSVFSLRQSDVLQPNQGNIASDIVLYFQTVWNEKKGKRKRTKGPEKNEIKKMKEKTFVDRFPILIDSHPPSVWSVASLGRSRKKCFYLKSGSFFSLIFWILFLPINLLETFCNFFWRREL